MVLGMRLCVVALGAVISPAAGVRVPLVASTTPRSPAVSMNFIENMKQMTDQRVAKVGHVMLKSGTPMPIDEALAKVEGWKAEIGTLPPCAVSTQATIELTVSLSATAVSQEVMLPSSRRLRNGTQRTRRVPLRAVCWVSSRVVVSA